eukprot:TRINITY_DN12049_c0_g1_i1.p1 TRINITY_DN12049_c0_g1~~TRINITY_DN12049_c0_g1_i1.p1  ORF type:complete len:108 (-),score=4.48 TRINITY_DN12049_c0_g1_i1:201-524(-)
MEFWVDFRNPTPGVAPQLPKSNPSISLSYVQPFNQFISQHRESRSQMFGEIVVSATEPFFWRQRNAPFRVSFVALRCKSSGDGAQHVRGPHRETTKSMFGFYRPDSG